MSIHFRPLMFTSAALCAGLLAVATRADAQLVASANDGKALLIDGVVGVRPTPLPDSVTILDLSAGGPKVIGKVHVPTSVVGPPESVAIAPGGAIAIVTAATRVDPADRTKTTPDDTVSVIDLKASPLAVIATLRAGRGASGISINRAGTLALVANRIAGTISVFTIAGRTLTPSGTIDLGAPDSGPSHVAFTPNGQSALVTRNNDSLISILAVSGTTVTYTKKDFAAGLKPYGLEMTPAGDLAVVAHIGAGPTGGIDTLALVDLAGLPGVPGAAGATPHTIAQVGVGPTVEGVAVTRDGQFVAATVLNGSNAPKASPFWTDHSVLKVFAIRNRALVPVTEAKIGVWCQGAAWSADGRTVLAQCMNEQAIRVFRFDGRTLTASTPIAVDGGPAGIRAAE